MAPTSVFDVLFPAVHCDAAPASQPSSVTSRTASAIQTVKSAMAVPENELNRWKRTFESNAQTIVNGDKYVSFSLVYRISNLPR